MSRFAAAIRRECRVVFSRRAQPTWFRAVKWMGILGGSIMFHSQSWFWWTLACLAAAGTLLHFFYRWKTKCWTRAWGGWNDLEAGRDEAIPRV